MSSNPHNDDAFCFYCQHQYASKGRLIAHLKKKHKGTYAYYSVAGGDQEEAKAE